MERYARLMKKEIFTASPFRFYVPQTFLEGMIYGVKANHTGVPAEARVVRIMWRIVAGGLCTGKGWRRTQETAAEKLVT